MKFNLKEIDPVVLKERAAGEAKKIFAKESTRRDRTYEEILKTCMYGQAAEVYMLSQGFTDNPEPFQDVLDHEEPIEVKVTEGEHYVEYVLRRCVAKKQQSYTNHPNYVYVWINDKKSFDYYLHGIYKWNGKEFCLQ